MTRAWSRSSFPRPYIWRFTSLSLVIWPSVWPFDHGDVIAALTAALSLTMPFANDATRFDRARTSQGSRSRIQYEGYLHREEANAAILGLAKNAVAIKEIVRRTGRSRGLVRKVLRGQRSDVFRVRESSLELHLPWLDDQWPAGQREGAALWRRLS